VRYDGRTRRQFLQGASGALLALPFLPSLLPREAQAQAAAPPTRYVQIIDHYGRAYGAWGPTSLPNVQQQGEVYAQKLSEISGPISPTFGTAFDGLRDKMTIVQGLDCLDEYTTDGSRLDSHSPTIPTTAAAYKKEIENNTQKNLNFPYSIDAVLEESKVIYPSPPLMGALRLAPFHRLSDPYYEFGSFSWTSKTGTEMRITAEMKVENVYNKIFMGAQAPDPTSTGPSRRKVATDLVLDDYKNAMQSRRIAADDRIRLDNWMAFLTDATIRLGTPVKPVIACNSVMAPPPGKTGEDYETNAADLIVAAFACGATRVASWSIMHHVSDINYAVVDDHSVGHNSNHMPGSLHAQHNSFVALRVADFLTKLDAFREPNGKTLLDNTIVYFTNEDTHGAHMHTDLPVVLAGGGGKLRMGYHMDFRPRPLAKSAVTAASFQLYVGRPMNQLLVTMFQAMGLTPADYQKFGKTGFGEYDRHRQEDAALYAPFKTDAVKNAPLPFLYLG
jgi:hypothetical protein